MHAIWGTIYTEFGTDTEQSISVELTDTVIHNILQITIPIVVANLNADPNIQDFRFVI
jgi:hypothetical protein